MNNKSDTHVKKLMCFISSIKIELNPNIKYFIAGHKLPLQNFIFSMYVTVITRNEIDSAINFYCYIGGLAYQAMAIYTLVI